MPEDLRVIVAGGGRVGFRTAELLDDRGHDVVLVERDPRRSDEIADAYVATVIEGDATRPEILRQAAPGRSDVVAALTGNGGANLAICMAAAEMAAEEGVDLRTVARIDRPDAGEYLQFVDSVVHPERAGARVAANEIVGSDVQTLADVTGTLDIMEVRVAEDAPAAGRALKNVNFPSGSLVISDDDGDRISRPDTTLDPGKRYVVAAEPEVVDEVMNLLRG